MAHRIRPGKGVSIFSNRKFITLPAGAAALLMVFLVAAAPMPRAQDRKGAESQEIFATRCAGCHGTDGKGAERAPDIVTRPAIRQLSDAQLLDVFRKGVPQTSMPPFSYLGDDVLRSLVVHLRTLQGNPAATALSGDAKRGREVFFGKGRCSQCHMAHGEGGFFASDLTHYASGRAPEAIHDAIVFPNRDLAPRQRTVVITLANGQTLQGIALNEDNFSIQVLTQDGGLHLLSKANLRNLAFRNESPMPADYATRLSTAEIDDLVNFLASLANQETNVNQKHESDEE